MTSKDSKKSKKNIKVKGEAADMMIAELEEQLKEVTTEKEEIFEKLQRISADYANYQKRAPRQIADSVAYEKKAIIRSMLPALDNLAHAIAGAKDHNAEESVVKGIELVLDHMLNSLKAHGVERIVALGEEFDPSLHEAMLQRTEEDKPDNIVLEEFQSGYTLNGQVILPSKVIVNKLPGPAQEQAPEAAESDEKEE